MRQSVLNAAKHIVSAPVSTRIASTAHLPTLIHVQIHAIDRTRRNVHSKSGGATCEEGGGAQAKRGGSLRLDRDYHVHLGGAVSKEMLAKWEMEGHLDVDLEIEDLVHPSGRKISVQRALDLYRPRPRTTDKESHLLWAYQRRYPSLPVFLTMYRAYGRRSLVRRFAADIARECIDANADIRVSLPDPSFSPVMNPEEWASYALAEMKYFRCCLLPTQTLVLTIPRQTFSCTMHYAHFCAFVDLLASLQENAVKKSSCAAGGRTAPEKEVPESSPLDPVFDFAGKPVPVDLQLPLLQYIRTRLPAASLFYHHGELCAIPLAERVDDALKLLPWVDRIGHAICLGVAMGPGTDPLLASMAQQCVKQMAQMGIAVECSPTCNLSLGGASNLDYVPTFLEMGVHILLGTDDPGFMGTTLSREAQLLSQATGIEVFS